MTDNALTVFERQLTPLAPRFADVLGNTMPVERLIRTIVISVERLPRLLECNRQSLFNAAMSAACLGLEVDGVTGQAFLVPFKDKAQLVIGYKGYNTLGARSGLTINGAVVREGDKFDYELGDKGFVRHRPKLDNRGARIIAGWAVAAALDRPPVVSVLSIDEIMAIKAKSPGARKEDSPWNDSSIGFPAMAEKSAKRRLARSLPLNIMQVAARMDEAFEEQGRHSWITPEHGVQIEGETVLPPRQPSPTPTAQELIAPPAQSDAPEKIPTWEDYCERWSVILDEAKDSVQLTRLWNEQRPLRDKIDWPDPTGPNGQAFTKLRARVQSKVDELKKSKVSA
jgi:recombination protein RecT